jgi:hypothetical protein
MRRQACPEQRSKWSDEMPDLLTQTTGAEVEATVPVNQMSVSREKSARRAVIGTPLVLIRRLTAQTSVASLAILAVFLPVIDGILETFLMSLNTHEETMAAGSW